MSLVSRLRTRWNLTNPSSHLDTTNSKYMHIYVGWATIGVADRNVTNIVAHSVCCSVLQYVAVCCSVLQCVAVWCSVLIARLQTCRNIAKSIIHLNTTNTNVNAYTRGTCNDSYLSNWHALFLTFCIGVPLLLGFWTLKSALQTWLFLKKVLQTELFWKEALLNRDKQGYLANVWCCFFTLLRLFCWSSFVRALLEKRPGKTSLFCSRESGSWEAFQRQGTCVTWLFHVYGMTQSITCVPWLTHICHEVYSEWVMAHKQLTDSYVSRAVTRCFSIWDLMHSYVWCDACIWATWCIYMGNVKLLSDMCDMTHSLVCHDSLVDDKRHVYTFIHMYW